MISKKIMVVWASLMLVVAATGCTQAALGGVEMTPSASTPLPAKTTESVIVEVPEPVLILVTPTAVPLPVQDGQIVDGNQTDALGLFEEHLRQTVSTRNFENMPALMRDPFSIGFWLSEGVVLSVDAAVTDMEAHYLASDSSIVFGAVPDLSPAIKSDNVLERWNPADNPVSALFSTGWGRDGAGEALLIVAEPVPGTYQWVGMLYAGQGFMIPLAP